VEPKSVIPVSTKSDDGKGGSGFKTQFGKPLCTSHHHVDLAWAFTDFKVQGLTWNEGEKLIISLNKSTAVKNLTIKTISVCLSRVTRLEDIRILPIDLDDPESDETKHLRKLKPERYTRYWLSGYDEDGVWDQEQLREVQEARRHALKVQFANVDLEKLPKGTKDTRGLIYWLNRFGIRPKKTDHLICDFVVTLNQNVDDMATGEMVRMNRQQCAAALRRHWDVSLRTKQPRGDSTPSPNNIV